MIVEQFYTSCLSQASYYIECKGEVAIIDPSREIDHFLDKAKSSNSKIKYIFQTHFHADFVSGFLTLSKKTDAPIVYGPNADPSYDCIIANEDDTFKIGNSTIKVIHTPGHTLESTSYLLIDSKNMQHSIFTGDTLFLGDVGIPDVAQRYKGMSKEDLAGVLYDSINNKIKLLDDHITVYPGHGAGSACGKSMMKETVDTLSNQKIINYSLNGTYNKKEFIKELTNNLPDPPAYFPANVKLNQEGCDDLKTVMSKSLNEISPKDYDELINNERVVIIDTRDSSIFSKYHLPNSIFIGLNGRFAPWIGEVLKDVNTPIIIVSNSGKEKEAIMRLARIGFDNCLGYINLDNKNQIYRYSEPVFLKSIEPKEFIKLDENHSIVDVRTENEFNNGSYMTANNIPLNTISDKIDHISDKSYIFCAGGYRSVIACSILMKNGKKDLINVLQGYGGIKNEMDL